MEKKQIINYFYFDDLWLEEKQKSLEIFEKVSSKLGFTQVKHNLFEKVCTPKFVNRMQQIAEKLRLNCELGYSNLERTNSAYEIRENGKVKYFHVM